MQNLILQLEKFFVKNNPVMILNTSTDSALLCLNPDLEILDGMIQIKFESLNDNHGNCVLVRRLQGFEDKTLYLENEEDNILMLQALNLGNYNHYIKKQYFNSPDFNSEAELKAYILAQKSYAW